VHSTCFFFALTSSIITTTLGLMFIILLDVKVIDLKKKKKERERKQKAADLFSLKSITC